jgi:hypothetical protein
MLAVCFSPTYVHRSKILGVMLPIAKPMPNTNVESLWHEYRRLGIRPSLVDLYSIRAGDYVVDTRSVADF